MADNLPHNVASTFTGTGTSSELVLTDIRSLSISGLTAGSGTILLERSVDDGSTWGTVATYTADTESGIIGLGWRWRLNCSVFSSGTFTYFMGRIV